MINVKDSSDDFLRYLDKKGIAIGCLIKVIAIEPYDKSMQIEIDGQELMISEEVAENLWMQAHA